MAFNIPINSIVPYPTPVDWVRPADWITITDVENEVQFLVADTGLKSFAIETTFTQNSGTNIYIDWGDGVIDTITTPTIVTTNHVYSTGGTPCSRGYNTFKIRIYGDATCVITNVKHISNFSVTGGNPFYSVGVLEAYFGDGTMEGVSSSLFSSNGGTNSVVSFTYLEYVKLPATVNWASQMENMFLNCVNLYKVVMPTSASSLLTLSNTFNGCTNLLDITLPLNAFSITSFLSTFSGCRYLRTVSFPPVLNYCVSFNSAFAGCLSLKNVTLPSIDQCTDLSNIFQSCSSLQWVRFTSLPTPVLSGTPVSLQNMFISCTSLQNVYFPSACSSNAVYILNTAFYQAYNLKSLIFPINFNTTTLSSTFQDCQKLTNIVFQSPCPALINMSSTFNSCYLLSSVTLPSTVGASVNLSNTFRNCYAFASIIIPSGWIINNLSNTFQNCFNIKTITLPNNAQNSIASMGLAFNNCYKLESVTMPTSLNLVSTIQNAFSNCLKITSIVLPASMPALTTLSSAFTNCPSLISATLPTSATALTFFSSLFQGCINIETVTLPANVGPVNNVTQMFTGCTSLKTITLPITQMSTVASAFSFISQCGALTTINNLSKLGSFAATPLVNGASFGLQAYALQSLSFNCPFSSLGLNGASSTSFNKLNSLRLLNTGVGQWTGSSPQINVSYCDLGIAALDQLFTDLTTVTSKTINITGCTGAAGCTRSIATAKGWTVTG
jgi:hypothetical protein